MKLLFFDIDGTLVSFRTHQIPESAIRSIEAAHDAGHKVIIATGRPMAIINCLGALQERELIDAYITMNGACCHAGDKLLHAKPIPSKEVEYMARMCEHRGYPCIFVGENDIAIAGADLESVRIFAEDLAAPPLPRTDFAEPLKQPIFQITPFFSAEAQGEFEAAMPGSLFARWHPAFVDITASGCDKARGIEVMAKHFGVDIADTIAFGDGGNDVPMLRRAGVGVAMGQAAPEVQVAADMVTAPIDDDGIALALQKLL